jgi:hypothetical protein
MNMSANKITSNNLSAVRDLVALTGIDGEWREMGNHCQFRAVSGAILNYWKSTGTVNFQGPSLAAEEFKSMFFSYLKMPQTAHVSWATGIVVGYFCVLKDSRSLISFSTGRAPNVDGDEAQDR